MGSTSESRRPSRNRRVQVDHGNVVAATSTALEMGEAKKGEVFRTPLATLLTSQGSGPNSAQVPRLGGFIGRVPRMGAKATDRSSIQVYSTWAELRELPYLEPKMNSCANNVRTRLRPSAQISTRSASVRARFVSAAARCALISKEKAGRSERI
jgi:hypothetical protein